jgi:hypothetical protein
MKDELRCPHCGDLIGVYEPLITVTDGRPHETSRAAHPNPGAGGAQCFHRRCYQERAKAVQSTR